MNKLSILTKGIIKENPVLVLLLGCCPTLATTTGAINGLGMGVSTLAVLVCSNIVISLLKNIIPDKVRIPCYIVVIAGFVTIVQLLLKAYLPALDAALRSLYPIDRSKLYHPGKSRNVRIQEQRSGFCIRWTGHGYRLYAGSGLHGSYQRIPGIRYCI